MLRPFALALSLAACAADPSSSADGCPYAHAAGVVDAYRSGGACVYTCAAPDGGTFAEFCDGRCVSLGAQGNCGACGVTCSAPSVCVVPTNGGTPYCGR